MESPLSDNQNYGESGVNGDTVDAGVVCHNISCTEEPCFSSISAGENNADNDRLGCASIYNSYCLEWDKLFLQNDYFKKLKPLSMRGNLRSCRFRSICWKLFLEVLPENQSQWIRKTNEWRAQYEDLKNQLIVNPRNAEPRDLSINNPLSQEVESPWNQFFLDNELRLTIKQDVIRTFPEIVFFKDDRIRDMLTDILFCYARSHKQLSYRQGMHELLAPLIFVLHCDHQTFLHACEIESLRTFDACQSEITRHLLDPRFLEHDAYSLFYQIMETVEPWYVSKEIIPAMQRGALLSQPFCRPPEMNPSNVIVTKLTRIQDYLLKRFDPDLHERLQSMDIVPQIYGIRWVRLLFGREFPMQDLLMLWDAIFCDGISFDLVDYVFVAMLLYIRDALLTSDYASCLHLLMKYPPIADMQYFIDKALYLREPNELPCPPDYQYQKPAQFGMNGWNNNSLLSAGRITHEKRVTGSLGSSISSGLSSLRRPGSLIIGASQMSKSTSEPMNLITDTIASPQSAPVDFPEDPVGRKGSTASLSHIEAALISQSRGSVGGIRNNMSSQSLVQVSDTWRSANDADQPGVTGDSNVVSPPTSRTGKFFVFGGTRSARKSATKQKQQKNGEPDGSCGRVMTSVGNIDNMCRRCATELDVHIGTLQKHLLKQDHHGDDEVLLALAGIKQVRDVLKGVLKPSCLSDTDTESPAGPTAGWYSYSGASSCGGAGSTIRRQCSEGSAQSSLSTTPVHDMSRNRFYIATPDLLSSDTDITSPENLFLGIAAIGRSDGCDAIVARPMEVELSSVQEVETDQCVSGVSDVPHRGGRHHADHHQPTYGHTGSRASSHPNTPDGCAGMRSGFAGNHRDMLVDGVDGRKDRSLRVDEASVAHQRESSPINRLAGLLKNFQAKF